MEHVLEHIGDSLMWVAIMIVGSVTLLLAAALIFGVTYAVAMWLDRKAGCDEEAKYQ